VNGYRHSQGPRFHVPKPRPGATFITLEAERLELAAPKHDGEVSAKTDFAVIPHGAWPFRPDFTTTAFRLTRESRLSSLFTSAQSTGFPFVLERRAEPSAVLGCLRGTFQALSQEQRHGLQFVLGEL
jgi:hypothetical protein